MPPNLRADHATPKKSLLDRNDEILERIYIGRRFKNDTERLEKLFELYTKMTSQPALPKKSAKPKGGKWGEVRWLRPGLRLRATKMTR